MDKHLIYRMLSMKPVGQSARFVMLILRCALVFPGFLQGFKGESEKEIMYPIILLKCYNITSVRNSLVKYAFQCYHA